MSLYDKIAVSSKDVADSIMINNMAGTYSAASWTNVNSGNRSDKTVCWEEIYKCIIDAGYTVNLLYYRIYHNSYMIGEAKFDKHICGENRDIIIDVILNENECRQLFWNSTEIEPDTKRLLNSLASGVQYAKMKDKMRIKHEIELEADKPF